MKAGSVLLGRGAAEARDQGVRPGADEVEDDEALFSISELMILLITNSCWLGIKIYRQNSIFHTRIPLFTPRHLPHSQSNALNACVSVNKT